MASVVGNRFRVRGRWKDDDGDPADPTDPTIIVKEPEPPDGTGAETTYLVGQLTHPETGEYYVIIPCPTAGLWRARGKSEVGIYAAREIFWQVTPSAFDAP
jgi:hypothetical protein